jgi:hypothetical protein
MKFLSARSPRFWIIALLFLAAGSVAAVWGYAAWMDAPNTAPLSRAKEYRPEYLDHRFSLDYKASSIPTVDWCFKAKFLQFVTYTLAASIGVFYGIRDLCRKRYWTGVWLLYLGYWTLYAIKSSYLQCLMFNYLCNSKDISSLKNWRLKSGEPFSLYYLIWILLPLVIYTLILWVFFKRSRFWGTGFREYRVGIYIMAVTLLINGLFLEPTTWIIPEKRSGMENAWASFDETLRNTKEWHLRNHLMLIAAILAIKSWRIATQADILAEPIEGVQPSLYDVPLRPEDGNPYRFS